MPNLSLLYNSMMQLLKRHWAAAQHSHGTNLATEETPGLQCITFMATLLAKPTKQGQKETQCILQSAKTQCILLLSVINKRKLVCQTVVSLSYSFELGHNTMTVAPLHKKARHFKFSQLQVQRQPKNPPALFQQIARHSCLLPIWILLKLTVEKVWGAIHTHTHKKKKTRGKKKKYPTITKNIFSLKK